MNPDRTPPDDVQPRHTGTDANMDDDFALFLKSFNDEISFPHIKLERDDPRLVPLAPRPEELANRMIAPVEPVAAPRIRIVAPSETVEEQNNRGRTGSTVKVEPSRPQTTPVGSTVLEFRAFDDRTSAEAVITVVIPKEVRDFMAEHADESSRRQHEVGGFLIGTVKRVSVMNPQSRQPEEPSGYLVNVTDATKVKSRSSSVSHVQFDQEAWAKLNEECDTRYSPEGKVRLGWYHTHPTQGIFFSDVDLNGHLVWQRPYQFGLVIDPQTMQSGLFHWTDYPVDVNSPAAVLRECLGEQQLFQLRRTTAQLVTPIATPAVKQPSTPRDYYSTVFRDEPEPEGTSIAAAAFLVVAVWVVVLFASLPHPTARGVIPPFNPTYLILTTLGGAFLLLRLRNSKADPYDVPPDHHDDELAWWRVPVVAAVLIALGVWVYRLAQNGDATTTVVHAVLSGLLMMEAWIGRLFRARDTFEARLARWIGKQFQGVAIRFGSSMGSFGWASVRGLGWLVRLCFSHTINLFSLIAIGLVIFGFFTMFDRGANPYSSRSLSLFGWLPGLFIIGVGGLLFVLVEQFRTEDPENELTPYRDPQRQRANPTIRISPTRPTNNQTEADKHEPNPRDNPRKKQRNS